MKKKIIYTVKFKHFSLELSIYKLKDQKNVIHLNVTFEERKRTFIVIFFFNLVSIL